MTVLGGSEVDRDYTVVVRYCGGLVCLLVLPGEAAHRRLLGIQALLGGCGIGAHEGGQRLDCRVVAAGDLDGHLAQRGRVQALRHATVPAAWFPTVLEVDVGRRGRRTALVGDGRVALTVTAADLGDRHAADGDGHDRRDRGDHAHPATLSTAPPGHEPRGVDTGLGQGARDALDQSACLFLIHGVLLGAHSGGGWSTGWTVPANTGSWR